MIWKKTREIFRQTLNSGAGSLNFQAGRDLSLHFDASTELVDQKIKEEVEKLRKSRFYTEFDSIRVALSLGGRLVEGDLSRGADEIKSWALAWCARLLSKSEELDNAEAYLNRANKLSAVTEIDVADAFMRSAGGEKDGALKSLAEIDSPLSRSSALVVIGNHEGAGGALGWLEKTGLEISELDPDGKHFALLYQLEEGRWDAAQNTFSALTEDDFESIPSLHHLAGMVHLTGAAPEEFRSQLLISLPPNPASFRLFSNTEALVARRTARHHFLRAVEVAHQFNCPRAAAQEEEYALWLELTDPEHTHQGRQRLQERLREDKLALHLVPLGLQYEVDGLRQELVEKVIEQQIALQREGKADTSRARLALAFSQSGPEDAANYIDKHYQELSNYLSHRYLRFLLVEMYAQAGLLNKAKMQLQYLLDAGGSEAEGKYLKRVLVGAEEGNDPVEFRKEQYKQNGETLPDLMALVHELRVRKLWDDLCKYGALLFQKTKSLEDIEQLTTALFNAQRSEDLLDLLQSNSDFVSQSTELQFYYSWALYYGGSLLEAREQFEKLGNYSRDRNYRTLQVYLSVALGDWNSLLGFVANEFKEREKREPQELMDAAKLAFQLGSPHAKELVFAAVAKGGDNPTILQNAYLSASAAGWEGDEEVSQWLYKAVNISGVDGPIQKVDLKFLLERKPAWDRQVTEVWRSLSRAEFPIFLAAQSLNQSLIDLTLLPAFTNLSENDPRRRHIIPAYSGKRHPVQFDLVGKTAGIDATALLTLSFVGILDKVLDTFDQVFIPHRTLAWLFEEKQQVMFHQPSRIRRARLLRDLIARRSVEEFSPSTVADSELAVQVGDELAMLIAEAEKKRDGDDTQRVVVRSSPVRTISALTEEEADLTEHAATMSSCLAIVEMLREKGQITGEEEKRARAYLLLQEKPWSDQPEITDRAVLYLDSLTVTYFLHLGVLEKIKLAGFRVVASSEKISEIDALIAYESITSEVEEAVEGIRSALHSRIESGKVKVGKWCGDKTPDEYAISQHPTVDVIRLAGVCDVLLSDDRFQNKHVRAECDSAMAPIYSTFDLLNSLGAAGILSSEDLSEYKTLLRRAGYFFIPISEDELITHLTGSPVKTEKVVESAELKAIRESILRVRMTDWIQLPEEAPWLHLTLTMFIKVLKKLWDSGEDLSVIIARSDWLIEQVALRGWAHTFGAERGDDFVNIGHGAYIVLLLVDPPRASQKITNAYWDWIEESVLGQIEGQFPDLYASIVEGWKRYLAELEVAVLSTVGGQA